MENLQYGNWIRKPRLFLLGLICLALCLLVVLPVAPLFRFLFAVLALGSLVSLLYPLYSFVIFSQKGGKLQDKFYELILSYVDPDQAGNLLDIGTGNGILAIKAALGHPALQVTGVDYWGRDWGYALNTCERNAFEAGVGNRVKFSRGNAAALDFPDASFEVVLSNLTFHEVKLVKRKTDVMREALRLLKPGGHFVFIDYFYDERFYGLSDEFEMLLWSLKLQQVELKPLQDLLPFPKLLRHPRALGHAGLLFGRK